MKKIPLCFIVVK